MYWNCSYRVYNIKVLNLVINGMPSILVNTHEEIGEFNESFKPCYKWNAFNTINCFRC